MNFPNYITNRNYKRGSILTAIIFILLIAINPGCKGGIALGKPSPILNDTYTFYILDPGMFTQIGPEEPSEKEFLILRSDGVELSIGRFRGGYLSSGDRSMDITAFAMGTVHTSQWLPGCQRWELDSGEVMVGDQWYFSQTLLVRRDAGMTDEFSLMRRKTHAHEIELFPVGQDMIVKMFYTLKERDIYILTFAGTPEDIVSCERKIGSLLSEIRLSAAEALTETGAIPGE